MSFNFLRPFVRQAAGCKRRTFFTSSARNAPTNFARATRIRPLLCGAGLFATAFALQPKVHLDTESQVPEPPKTVETTTDPATGIQFPNSLQVPSKIKLPELTLLGVGVRTVSFLGIKVYSVGFYADLENPDLKIPKDLDPEQKAEHIVRNTACVVRIVPTRNTNYTHLRDAFMRSLQARMVTGRQNGSISEEVEVAAGSPLRKLKSLFPNSALTKNTPLDVFLSAPTPGRPRALVFRDMGAIENDWVATELVLHYFTGEGPSPPLKKAVLERLSSLEK
ncbi:Altered inheritance of mitochondria protein 18 mitochondrial [Pleurotus ostreatus]|nr:Altered inheritance of mitochondria protein 18 mitochondrial [Pleurotus ostreatus]